MTQTARFLRRTGMALLALMTVGVLGLNAQDNGAPLAPVAFELEFNGNPAELFLTWQANPEGPEATGFNIYAGLEMGDPTTDLVEIATTSETEITLNMEEIAEEVGMDASGMLMPFGLFVSAYNDNGESEKISLFGSIDPRDGMDDDFIKFDIRVHELIGAQLGPWMRPLTDGEKDAILTTLREEFGDDLPYNPFDMGMGGEGHDNEEAEKILDLIKEILADVAGEDFDGDPCDLTDEQIAEINKRLADEIGGPCPPMLMCGHHGGGDIDPELFARFNERLNELIEIAMEDGEITEEEGREIEDTLRAEFGDLPFDIGFGGGDWGDQGEDEIGKRMQELFEEAGGADWDGDPCSLTEDQRKEIAAKLADEFGMDFGWLVDCSHRDLDKAHERLEELLREAAGDDWNGDLCALTQEQREEIYNTLKEEFDTDFFDWLLHACPDDDGIGHDDPMFKLKEILAEIGGADWDGDPCSLTDEQRAEAARQLAEELGVDEISIDFGCDRTEWEGPDDEEIRRMQERIDEIIKEVLGEDFDGEPTQEQIEEIMRRIQEELGDIFGDCVVEEDTGEVVYSPSNRGGEGAEPTITSVTPSTSVNQLRSFPNPAVESVNLQFNAKSAGAAVISLIDPAGNTVLSQNMNTAVGQNTTNISLGTASSGTYFVRIELNGGVSQMIPVVVVR